MDKPVVENPMRVDLRELEDGETRLTFRQDAKDLDLQPEDASFSGQIETAVTLIKLNDSLSALGKSQFGLKADCARCSEPITLSFEAEFAFVFQKGNKPRGVEGDEDETLIWLEESSDELDLGKEVRDYILLEIPINPVCEAYETGTCPKLAAVEEIERAASGEVADDPRWAALKELKLDN